MSKKILFFVYFVLISGIVYAQSLQYIGNPETMECEEYFSGIRAEGFSIDIGESNDFKNIDQACAVFRCTSTDGTILVDEKGIVLEKNLCRCPEGKSWDESKGCIGEGDLITGEAVFIPEKTRLNYLVVIITILIITALIFFIKKVKK